MGKYDNPVFCKFKLMDSLINSKVSHLILRDIYQNIDRCPECGENINEK